MKLRDMITVPGRESSKTFEASCKSQQCRCVNSSKNTIFRKV
jgi:hypothetical protein